MIRQRKTTKNCDICKREVAVQEFFRFRTLREYVTLREDQRSILNPSIRNDVHICHRCWEKMAERVNEALEYEAQT